MANSTDDHGEQQFRIALAKSALTVGTISGMSIESDYRFIYSTVSFSAIPLFWCTGSFKIHGRVLFAEIYPIIIIKGDEAQ